MKPIQHDRWILSIAIFKFVKAVLLIAAAIGVFSLINKDAAEVITYRISQLGVDPQNYHIQAFVRRLGFASDRTLLLVSAGTFVYAALFLTEGIGLYFQKRWAEYFTICITGSFIPMEIYDLTRHMSYFKILVVVVNVATVIYLIYRLKHPRRNGSQTTGRG